MRSTRDAASSPRKKAPRTAHAEQPDPPYRPTRYKTTLKCSPSPGHGHNQAGYLRTSRDRRTPWPDARLPHLALAKEWRGAVDRSLESLGRTPGWPRAFGAVAQPWELADYAGLELSTSRRWSAPRKLRARPGRTGRGGHTALQLSRPQCLGSTNYKCKRARGFSQPCRLGPSLNVRSLLCTGDADPTESPVGRCVVLLDHEAYRATVGATNQPWVVDC